MTEIIIDKDTILTNDGDPIYIPEMYPFLEDWSLVAFPEDFDDNCPAVVKRESKIYADKSLKHHRRKINVRKSPDKNSSVIKAGNRGDTFTYVDKAAGSDGDLWYNIINKSGQAGWVSSQYSKIIIGQKATSTPIPTDVPEEERFDFSEFGDEEDFDFFADSDDEELVEGFNDWENENFIGIVKVVNCDDWVSSRSKPNTKSSRLAKVPKGDQLEAYKCENSKFYKCYYDGMEGYILKKYLKVVG